MRGRAIFIALCTLALVCNVVTGNEQDADVVVLEEGTADYNHHALVKVEVATQVQQKAFAEFAASTGEELDMWQEGPGKHHLVRLAPKHLAMLQARTDLPMEVLHKDIQQLIEASAQPAGPGFFQSFHHVDHLIDRIKELPARHSGEVTVSKLGNSVEGRPIMAIHIADKSLPEDAPEFVIVSGQHAREWIGPAASLLVTEAIASTHANDKQAGAKTPATPEHFKDLVKAAQSVLSRVRLTVVPLLNPDGYAHTMNGDRMWRKNRRKMGGSCVGVDTNRNWPYHFAKTMVNGELQHDDTSCESSTYEGKTSLSEPEPKAVAEYILDKQKKHNKRVQGFLDVHSFSQKVLPPGCNGFPVPEAEATRLLDVAHQVANVMSHGEWKSDQGYESGSCQQEMYPCSGVAHDWAYGAAGVHTSLAIELRPGEESDVGFMLPADKIEPVGLELLSGTLKMSEIIAAGSTK